MNLWLLWLNSKEHPMRDAFVAELTRLAEVDPSVMLITGDLGFGVLAEFSKRFPRQYLNAGIAEQNMTGVAAGMALTGHRVFTYSIANFPTLRCLEQIRNDICYHHLPVTVVSIGGGFAYGPLGFSHHACEDVAVMGALPGMRVLSPNDPIETTACTRIAGTAPGPTYLRLGRNGEKKLHSAPFDITSGTMIEVHSPESMEVAIIAGCGALDIAMASQELLKNAGISAGVWSSPWIEPFDQETALRLARSVQLVVTVEEHSFFGGLGTRVAQACATAEGVVARVIIVGVPREPMHKIGDQQFMRNQAGLTPDVVANRALLALEHKAARR